MPATAFATQTKVVVENYTLAGDQTTVSGLVIDGVTAPNPGEALDDAATVSSSEGAVWDIPVLWIADNLERATEAYEGRSYLPVLVFFLPEGYAIDGSEFTVTLSDSLTKLFGGNEVVSVYDSGSGITYILPASLRGFFSNEAQEAANQETNYGPQEWQSASSDRPSRPEARSPVDIYCAQTARDAFSDEDLEFLLDLVLNKLEPQAVELLLDSFPAFRAAADQGDIGRQIGLYVYFRTGDNDGVPEHANVPSYALANVGADVVMRDGEAKYCYMIGIDLYGLAKKDGEELVRNTATGKFVLVREGESMVEFENTLVHELFHAIMDDYNRTGMLGATDVRSAGSTGSGSSSSRDSEDLYDDIHYPNWFIEGTASTVENTYQYRYDMFKMLRARQGSETAFTDFYDKDGLLYNYLNTMLDGETLYFDLGYSNSEEGTITCSYESSYLATLYLSELAARKTVGSAIENNEGTVAISSKNLRVGLNSILERMHKGETLDQIVNDLSPVDANGKKLYSSTDDFGKKFIKGAGKATADGTVYSGDESSLEFTTTFLNYMIALENAGGQDSKPNGSILMDFNTERQSPLDNTRDSNSDYLKIVEENGYVESTVPNEVALSGGGKSVSGMDSKSQVDDESQADSAPAVEVTQTEGAAYDEVVAEEVGPQSVGESECE